jgi:hypothetical protein
MPLVVMEDRSGSGLDRRAQGRLAAMQNNVRTALQEIGTPSSSIYSRSPNVQQSPLQPTQDGIKPPRRQLFGLVPRTGNTPILRHMPNFHLPFGTRAESVTYSPATQPTEWERSPAPPSPVAQPAFRHPADTVPILNNEEDLEASLPPRPKKPRRRHRKQGSWTRKRKTQSGSRTLAALFQGETRVKAISTVVSGLFLISILAICEFEDGILYMSRANVTSSDLSIALVVKNLNQQIHILFILAILAALVFFTHSLVRLIVITRERKNPRRHRPAIPSVAGPEGFKPDVPIRVQLVRDEERSAYDDEGVIPEEKMEVLKQPPPAYGLWRGSVRLDPNLLHWQRNQDQAQDDHEHGTETTSPVSERRPSPNASPMLESVVEEPGVRRPPSYVSEDGVSYVVSALPPAPPSEIHPAFRIRLP